MNFRYTENKCGRYSRRVEDSDLSRVSAAELDSLWSGMLQRGENARETFRFYERRLDEGEPVSLIALERAQDRVVHLEAEQHPLISEWEKRGGWSRVFSDSYGLLHRSSECGRYKPHQHPQLLPALSGWDDRQVIEHAGLSVCTTCFPEAKDHPTYRRLKRKEAKSSRCPGSTRKPGEGSVCSVCGEPADITPKGRVRTHNRPA